MAGKVLVVQVVVVAEWCEGRRPAVVQDMVVRMCPDVKVWLVDVGIILIWLNLGGWAGWCIDRIQVLEDVIGKIEWREFAVAARSGNSDLCLAVCGKWWGAHVAGRRVGKSRWRNDRCGLGMELWR